MFASPWRQKPSGVRLLRMVRTGNVVCFMGQVRGPYLLSQFSYQFQLSLFFVAAVGQNWDDGGRNQNASQRVNSAVFGSDVEFFHCHIICQNLPLERSSDIFHSVLQGHQWSPCRSEWWWAHRRPSTSPDFSVSGRLLLEGLGWQGERKPKLILDWCKARMSLQKWSLTGKEV